MIRCLLLLLFTFLCFISNAQSKNAGTADSTFILFPNPSHDQFYVTSQGRIIYAMIITTSGAKKIEYLTYEIPSYPNQYGYGCISAGCAGAQVASNYICTLQRKNLDNGFYYLVLLDDQGRAYYKQLVLQ